MGVMREGCRFSVGGSSQWSSRKMCASRVRGLRIKLQFPWLSHTSDLKILWFFF